MSDFCEYVDAHGRRCVMPADHEPDSPHRGADLKPLDAAPALEDFEQEEPVPELTPLGSQQIGAFHRDARETERAAALRQYGKLGDKQRKVLDWIAAQGEHGSTAEEAFLGIPMHQYTAAPRFTELKRGGWIVVVGERPTTTKSAADVHVLSAAAREALGL